MNQCGLFDVFYGFADNNDWNNKKINDKDMDILWYDFDQIWLGTYQINVSKFKFL